MAKRGRWALSSDRADGIFNQLQLMFQKKKSETSATATTLGVSEAKPYLEEVREEVVMEAVMEAAMEAVMEAAAKVVVKAAAERAAAVVDGESRETRRLVQHQQQE